MVPSADTAGTVGVYGQPKIHWTERWLGRRGGDCADLVAEVTEAEFGRRVQLPSRASGVRGLDRQIAQVAAEQALRINDPRDGDIALMGLSGRSAGHHVGVAAVVGGQPLVLHRRTGEGAALHSAAELARLGLHVLEWWRWA